MQQILQFNGDLDVIFCGKDARLWQELLNNARNLHGRRDEGGELIVTSGIQLYCSRTRIDMKKLWVGIPRTKMRFFTD